MPLDFLSLAKDKKTKDTRNSVKLGEATKTYLKTGDQKKVTIYFPIFYLVKRAENVLFFYLHLTS